MPKNERPQPHPNNWQPTGGYPQEAVTFLRALAAPDAAALGAWAAKARPDARWAEWLHRQHLAPFTYYRLRQAGALACAAGLPAAFVAALRGIYYNAAAGAELHTRELADALDVLAAAGVTAVLFKGAVLAHTAYPDPACRPMGDLDFWVVAEAMPRAQAALEGAGYRLHTKVNRPPDFQTLNEGEVQLVAPGGGSGVVELHYGVFSGEWLRRTTAIQGDCISCRMVPVTILGRAAWTLAPEDAIIQLAVHLAVTHQMAAAGLRGLLDVALLARTQPVDWPTVAERARGWRVAAATWLVLGLADALFGLPGVQAAIAGLQPHGVRRRLLSRFAGADSMLAGRDLRHGLLRFVYQLVLVDRIRDAARLLGRALWPEDTWLAARYGAATPAVRRGHLRSALRGKV